MTTGTTHTRGSDGIETTGLDGVVCKPTEADPQRVAQLPFELVCVDYEGQESVPSAATLASLADDHTLRVTTPVRADGFDPLGDDGLVDRLPAAAGRVLVAGHGAYLDETEQSRAVAPRLGAAVDAARAAAETAGRSREPWVGTESVERLALAAGGVQYELLSRRTVADLRGLRAAGFDGEIAVYAPTVPSTDEDTILDAVGAYAARRGPVRRALPDGAATDASADGRAREVLEQAVRDYALVGSPSTIRDRVTELKSAGADVVVGYPAAGVETFESGTHE
jgi:hypothetical protein